MGKVEFTEDQRKVIDTRDSNILVSAAAGSGKTAVLTQRIISLISDKNNPVDIDHMLIVTFTKAAAAEMRERIGKEIKKWINEHPDDENMQRQQTLLHNAQITTIDSFCLFVIRNNFSDIELDPGFRPMDDGEQKLLMKDILSEVLEEHYESNAETPDEKFMHLIDCYSSHNSSTKKDAELEEHILNLYNLAMSYPFPYEWIEKAALDYHVDTFEELEDKAWWKEAMRISEMLIAEAISTAQEGLRICREEHGPLAYEATLKMQEYYAKELLNTTDYEKRLRILNTMDVPALKRISASADVYEELKNAAKECREQVKKIFDDLKKKYYLDIPENIIENHKYIGKAADEMMLLVKEFAIRFSEAKREQNLIDFSDMEHLALDILLEKDENNQIVPSKAALEYQKYFAHVMVDEYQDSNYVQEYILKSVAKDNNYFMVGDVKQSIYRFRLAQPEIFLNKYELFSENQKKNVRIDLNLNFRSREEVLQSVNDVFEKIMDKNVAGIDYDANAKLYVGAAYPTLKESEEQENAEQINREYLNKKNIKNNTELCIVEKETNIRSDANTVINDSEHQEIIDEEEELSTAETEAWLVASKIRELFQNNYQVADAGTGTFRDLKYKDVVILLRSTGGLGDAIKDALEEDGIPAYLATKSGYFDTLEIRNVLNYLTIIDNPRQDIPLYGVLNSYFGKLSEEELAMVRAYESKTSLFDCVNHYMDAGKKSNLEKSNLDKSIQRKLKVFMESLNKYRELAIYTTVYELILRIFEDTGYLNYMTAFPGGTQRRANLYMLLEKANAFERTSYHGLFHFIRYIGQLKEQEVDYGEAGILDENADVIRIMTIHKSKGLEFPVCFICGMGKRINKKDASKVVLADASMGIGLDYIDPIARLKLPGIKKKMMGEKILLDSIAEEMRVLYVAMTRAKEKLIMTGVCKDANAILEKYPNGKKISSGSLLKANSYLDFVLAGYAAAGKINNYINVYTGDLLKGNEVEKRIDREVLKTLLLQNESGNNKEDNKENELKNSGLEEKSNISQLIEKLRNQFEFQYGYPELSDLYTKTTVTELKKNAYDDEDSYKMFDDNKAKREVYYPGFIKSQVNEVIGTQRGTAYHRMMELLPFGEFNLGKQDIHKATFDENEKENNLTQLLQSIKKQKMLEGFISEEDINLINDSKIERFLRSSLAQRMSLADRKKKLYKEKPFFMGVSAVELDSKFPSDELVLVQGVIDAFFEEEDGIVIMDYKTDRVDNEKELIDRYHTQLEIYARAVSQITGKKVKEKIIYSFTLEKEINV